MVIFRKYTDLDFPVSLQMIQCITGIVRYNFFNLEFICPHINRFISIETYFCFFLLNHNIHRLQDTSDHTDNIKTFYCHLIPSGFQLIQSEKITDKLVHLTGFIHNDITVKLPALRIFGNIFFQTFCIALYQCDRRLQLMRYIIQELLSHLIDPFFVLNIFLELIIDRFQFRDCLFKLF